jgi:hypothetical protein
MQVRPGIQTAEMLRASHDHFEVDADFRNGFWVTQTPILQTRPRRGGKMDHQLKLTAKGLAVCELMTDLGLTLEAACARVDHELETLRKRVDSILAESDWADVPGAMQAALESVSLFVQDAYLEESSADAELEMPAPSAPCESGAYLH